MGAAVREVVNIRSSDIGAAAAHWEKLAIACDEGKLVGALTGTGGVHDLVSDTFCLLVRNKSELVSCTTITRQTSLRSIRNYKTRSQFPSASEQSFLV